MLTKTTDLVYDILIHDTDARNSDDKLYVKVLEHYGDKLGVDFNRVSVTNFFNVYKRHSIPSIETVGRCRRKIQEEHADLMGNEEVTTGRHDREKAFRDYARKK